MTEDDLNDAAHSLFDLAVRSPTSGMALDDIKNWLTSNGWRKMTVTPEQLQAVIQILDDVPAVRFPETWMRKAQHIARVLGLSLVEEEQ